MRSFWVLSILGLSLVCGLWIYLHHPPNVESRFIDMVTASMKGIDKAVPAGSRIGVRRFVSFTMVNPINHYALASQHISLHESAQFDTLLVITSAEASDSILNEAVGRRKVLWQNQDSMYRYYITSSL